MTTAKVEARHGPEPALPYYAFISYRASDGRLARWLHSKLEQYRVPRSLVGKEGALGPIPRRLRPIFRDRDDGRVAGDLETILAQELSKSGQLVVVCSPEAAVPTSWVVREIDIFRQRRPGAPVHAVIADGEPPDCFPEPLLSSAESAQLLEPLAADFRPKRRGGKDGRRRALTKLIAALIGVRFDELWQRERRRLWAQLVIGGIASIMLGTVLLLAFQQVTAVSDSRRLATHAINLTERQYDLALLLAAGANATAATEEAEEALFHVVLTRPHFRGFMPPGTQVAMSSTGGLIAIGGADGAVQVFATPSNQPSAIFEGDRADMIRGLRFSDDGSRLVSLSEAGNIQVLDPQTKTVLRRFKAGFSGFMGLAFDYDSSDTFGTTHSTGGFPEAASPLALSRDGRRIALVNAGGFIEVADTQTGATINCLGPSRKDDKRPGSLSFNDGATALAIATPAGVEVWEVESQSDSPILRLDSIKAADVAFMHGDEVAIITEEGRLKGIDARAGKTLFEVVGHESRRPYSFRDAGALVSWARGSRSLVTTSAEGEIAVWRYADLVECGQSSCQPAVRFSRARGGHLSSLAVSEDGVSIATAAHEGGIERYSTLGAEELANPLKDMPQASLFAVAAEASASAFSDRTTLLVRSKVGVRRFEIPSSCDPATEIVLSPDGRWVAAASDHNVCIRSLADDSARWLPPLASPTSDLLLSPSFVFNRDGTRLAAQYRPISEKGRTSADDRGTVVWDLSHVTRRPHTVPQVAPVGFSNEGTLVIRDGGGQVSEIDASSGVSLTPTGKELGAATGSWAYSWHDKVLYSAGNPGIVVRSELREGRSEEFFQSANRPAGEYLLPAVSPDGERVAIANGRGEISLWTRDGRRLGGTIVLARSDAGIQRMMFAEGHAELLVKRKGAQIVRIDLRPARWAALARERAGRFLNDSERNRYARSAFRPIKLDTVSSTKPVAKMPADPLDACFAPAPDRENLLSAEQVFLPLACSEKLRDVIAFVLENVESSPDERVCTLYSEALSAFPILLSGAQNQWALRAVQRHDVHTAQAILLLGLSGDAVNAPLFDAMRAEDFTSDEWRVREWVKGFVARQGRNVDLKINASQASSIGPHDLLTWPACAGPAVARLFDGSRSAPSEWPQLRQASIPRPSVGIYIQLTRKGSAAAWTLAAELMLDQRAFESARALIARALVTSPEDAHALNIAGLIELRSQHCEVALGFFRQSILAGRRDGWPQYNTAECQVELGRLEEAEASYLAAIAKDVRPRSDEERASFLNGYAWFMLKHHKDASALVTAELRAREAVQITSETDANMLDTLASILHAEGYTAEAIEMEKKAISVDERRGKDATEWRQRLETFEARVGSR